MARIRLARARLARSGAVVALGLLGSFGALAMEQHPPPPDGAARKAHSSRPPGSQRGKASVYARRLARHRMADGTPLDLESDAAASPHLPLGSRARVTNLHNGRSVEVVIRDRGPYVKGRILDITPKSAQALGFRTGVRRVEVVPLPQPAGGAGAAAPGGGGSYRAPRRCRVFGVEGE
ncbi:MAG TPA: septal ring lytic transglycosylase RlpA family protein [Nevskia sp.]|nr:septal ring lytic transglycosylase RlpA family protein [Nevskia sp.]